MLKKSILCSISNTLMFLFLLFLVGACGDSGVGGAGGAGGATGSGGSAGSGGSQQSQGSAASEKTQYISIATASLGGSYYPIGVGMAEVFAANIGNIDTTVEVTGGATENPKLVGTRDSDIGITNANLAYAAYHGSGIFSEKAYPDVRMMFGGVAPGTIHIVVKADSNILTYSDLVGRKVAVGPQGGGGLSLLPDLFGIYNFTMADIRPSYMSYDEGVQAVIDGHVEAALVQAPHPAPAIKNIQGSGVNFRLLELDAADREAFLAEYPYYNEVDLPADIYGTDNDIHTIGSSNVVIINANVDEELVYQMTRAIFENLTEIYAVHPSAASISLATAVNEMIPMHPGAMRYFKEAGAAGAV
ncbi:MAG: TAXI family TRAP transporter solute-binding subunit [Peptococcaceae bacterium]|jgi:TRAP transporter TAXI family solute receptor|nr:TAXI family TRAP transporter solute-binding subunit [Peptococcaceae bacterium]